MLPTGFPETPDSLAPQLREWAQNGWLNIVGGCCGTTPGHIKLIAEAVRGLPPRVTPSVEPHTRLSGLEAVTIRPESNFVNIGERTNVTGSPAFSKLILAGDYEAALSVARQQVEGGAQIIDINMDEGMLDSQAAMEKFLRLVASEPDICRVPIMVDSSKWDILETGLKNIQGKPVVNSISLKEGEAKFLQQAKLVHRYGAAVVVMAFDERGQADTYERKIEVCERAYRLLTERIGFPAQDIIFDPNILTVATGIEEHNNYAVNFLEATRWIKQHLPLAKVSGGVSNISFSFRGNNRVREAMHAAFLYHAIKAGLDMGIVNAGQLAVYEEIPKDLLELVEDVLLNRRPDATERLVTFAETVKQQGKAVVKDDEWRVGHGRRAPLPCAGERRDRLHRAGYRGSSAEVCQTAACDRGTADGRDEHRGGPVRVRQDVLAASGQERQGHEESRGLPHAIHGGGESTSQARRARTERSLLATVKGDVHDIGKNIVGVVLGCNNYEVIDLGVMVPCEQILAAAREHGVAIIGLSGLITPSLDEMAHVARELTREGFDLPLLIGGATTSKAHTAVKIAPGYNHSVVHVLDASRAVGVVGQSGECRLAG